MIFTLSCLNLDGVVFESISTFYRKFIESVLVLFSLMSFLKIVNFLCEIAIYLLFIILIFQCIILTFEVYYITSFFSYVIMFNSPSYRSHNSPKFSSPINLISSYIQFALLQFHLYMSSILHFLQMLSSFASIEILIFNFCPSVGFIDAVGALFPLLLYSVSSLIFPYDTFSRYINFNYIFTLNGWYLLKQNRSAGIFAISNSLTKCIAEATYFSFLNPITQTFTLQHSDFVTFFNIILCPSVTQYYLVIQFRQLKIFTNSKA